MGMKFEHVGFGGIGGRTKIPGKQIATLSIGLEDDEGHGHFARVDVPVLVDHRSDVTLGELEEQGRAAAIEILTEALSLLQQHTIAALRERESSQDAEREAEREAAFSEKLSDIFKRR